MQDYTNPGTHGYEFTVLSDVFQDLKLLILIYLTVDN